MISELRSLTGIDTFVLQGGPLEQVSIAGRMSWAAYRQTSRKEDIAYSLLGILGVNIPLLYGEGSKAFLRLQEEILRQSDDQTLFAWRAAPSDNDEAQVRGLFASSPKEFRNFFDGLERSVPKHQGSHRAKDHLIRLWDSRASREPMTISNRGIRITGQIQDLRPNYESLDTIILLLNCCFGGNPVRTAGIYLRRQDEGRYARVRPDELASVEPLRSHTFPLTLYGLGHTAQVRGHHYDQPWTSSYKIRLELGDLEHSKFEDVQATKGRYEHAFYVRAKCLKPSTVFGQYKLHGVLIADSRGLLRFFCFYPDDPHMDIVLKTYPGFRVVLLYRAPTSSDLLLVMLGRKPQAHDGGQHWVTATYLTKLELKENSSRLFDAVRSLTEATTNSKAVSCDVKNDKHRLHLSLIPGPVEGISMTQLQVSGPWPASSWLTVMKLLRPFLLNATLWAGMIVFLTIAVIGEFEIPQSPLG